MKVFVSAGTQVAGSEYFGPVFTLNDFSIVQPGANLTVHVAAAKDPNDLSSAWKKAL